jgi:hypothetical protein
VGLSPHQLKLGDITAWRKIPVKRAQLSLTTLLALVGLAALDFALARMAFLEYRHMTVGLCLIVLVVQWGTFGMILGPIQVRAFCAGFVAAGALAACSYMIFRMCPDSWIAMAWACYARFVEYAIKHLPFLCHRMRGGWDNPIFAGVIAVFAFLPQFGAALIGGVSASLLTKVPWPLRCPCRLA